MNTSKHPCRSGFTLIELMVVIALVAIILSLAVPSFREMIARNKLEGVAGEFITDLQYTRSEAVARNANLTVSVGAAGTCYTAHPAAVACNCQNASPCATATDNIKTVSFANTGVVGTASVDFEFEPVRGSLNGVLDKVVTLTSNVGGASLQAEVLAVGRVKTCSPSGSFKGYPSC